MIKFHDVEMKEEVLASPLQWERWNNIVITFTYATLRAYDRKSTFGFVFMLNKDIVLTSYVKGPRLCSPKEAEARSILHSLNITIDIANSNIWVLLARCP